ncbi:MAG TPA: hypothetical protein VFM35_08040 [Candidatus Binatia bacterium]|nr:hypothetical protein [Candidatus Binatia bacterium]
MDPMRWIADTLTMINQWAKTWNSLIALAGIIGLFWYVLETYRIRLATVTQGAPTVKIGLDQITGRITARNVEGRIAYSVKCSPFSGATEIQDVEGTVRLQGTCRFDLIDALPPLGKSTELNAYMNYGKQSEILLGAQVLFLLRSASAPMIGLPLQVRYHDGLGFRYAVRVRMPDKTHLDFWSAQPDCSPPVPLTMLASVKTVVFWRLSDAVIRWRIRLVRWREARAEHRAAKRPAG